MPFPSAACPTCRQRRIKCDEIRPECTQCLRSGRDCPGYDREPGSMLFVNENAHASTAVPRLRGGARLPRIPSEPINEARNERRRSSASSSRKTGRRTIPSKSSSEESIRKSDSIPDSLPVPLEEQAITAFVAGHLRSFDNAPYENLWAVLGACRDLWSPAHPDSTLSAALAAASLAFFGRVQHNIAALAHSRQRYTQALLRTQAALTDEVLATTDKTLMSVMLLVVYEQMVGGFNRQTLYADSYRHQDGATALLHLRKTQRERSGISSDASLKIDRQLRRVIVRHAIYRADGLDTWLQDGAAFGESGADLALDKCVVRVALIRYACRLFKQNPDPLGAYNLVQESIATGQLLNAWTLSVDNNMGFDSIDVTPEFLDSLSVDQKGLVYGKTMHDYPSLESAVVWNQYRAARIVAEAGIAKGLIHLDGSEPADAGIPRYLEVLSNIQGLVNDICASIPYLFKLTNEDPKLRCSIRDANAKHAYLLVFPLVIAGSVSVVHQNQRRWILSKLLLVSQVSGNNVLEQVANMDLAGCD